MLALTVYGSIVNIAASIAHGEAAALPVAAAARAAGSGIAAAAAASGGAGLVPLYVWAVVGGFVLCTALVAVVLLAALRLRPHRT